MSYEMMTDVINQVQVETQEFMDNLQAWVEAEVVKVEDLVISEAGVGQVWILYCDLYCLDYDGNVMDAALLALLAALQETKLPVLEMGPAERLVVAPGAAPRPVVLNHTPVALTLAVIDTHVVADPTQ